MVQIDIREAVKKLTSEYGALSKNNRNLAVARALNHTIAKAKTQASKEIRSIYDIPAKDVNKTLVISKADRLTLTALIKAKGKPIPLIKFRAKQLLTGVSVITPTGRKVIPGVFIATMPSGHIGVFVRGKYSSGNIARRKKRIKATGNDLPISELVGVSIPKTLANKVILRNLETSMNQMFPSRLKHELEHITMPI